MRSELITARVAAKCAQAQDIWSLDLVAANGGMLPDFTAGAHIDVHLGATIRQYSLCNGPDERDRYRIAVLRDAQGRGGSVRLCDTLRPGDEVRISAPRNHFPLADDARRSLLFAGGIGITPLLAMAQTLDARAADFTLHYCTRSADRTAFGRRLRESRFAARVAFHHGDGPAEQKLDIAAAVGAPDPRTHLYVCGPGGFIDAVRFAAQQAGWPAASVHYEFFANDLVDKTAGTGSFQIRIASTGATLDVPVGRSIVDVVADAGIEVPVSCEQGVCGTCLTRVLDGVPDHQDLYLTDNERSANDQMLPCCSRAVSPLLVLDL